MAKGTYAWLLCGLTFLALSCEREIPPMSEPVKIIGYRIEGLISDRLGNPVRGVPIALHYDYELVDQGPPPSKEFQVVDRDKTIRVIVYDRASRFVRLLFQGRPSPGPLLVEWDKRDVFGALVPSGVYSVQYLVDGDTKKTYYVTVSGSVTARSDSLGHYSILDENLPVGFHPVPLYTADNTSFLGNYRISSYVVLEFFLEPRRILGVVLTRDQITRADLRV